MRFLLLALMIAATGSLTASPAAAEESVRYRCVKWKAKHIHDSEKADKIAATLEKLQCEVEKSDHSGHIDVRYRCPEWKVLELTTHDEAHQWESWLKEYGFETEHKH